MEVLFLYLYLKINDNIVILEYKNEKHKRTGRKKNMAGQIKGYCKYCGKEYTKSGMLRHLQACKDREFKLSNEKVKSGCRYFEIVITGKYQKEYWLIIEINENTTLKKLDQFIRDIWVECCGHLSMFICNGLQYESCPDTDSFWGKPSKNMNYRLKDVADIGDTIFYEYDFGSTTELTLNIYSCREGQKGNNKIEILSRNNPPKIMCSNCEKNEARWINPYGYHDGTPFLCEECLEADDDLEIDYVLPICNSPRMGVCGYEGSRIYPDQFKSDKEQGQQI